MSDSPEIQELTELRWQLAMRTAERDQFRGIFGEYDEPPRTVEQARLLWNTLKQQLAASHARCAELKEVLKFYADPQIYGLYGGNSDRVMADHGKRAIKALTGERPPA